MGIAMILSTHTAQILVVDAVDDVRHLLKDRLHCKANSGPGRIRVLLTQP